MRAQQIVELTGPANLELVDLDEPKPEHMLAPDGRVVTIDVEAAGVSFPEVLQSRGEYQFKPPLPFVPGAEVAGTVKDAPGDSGLKPGDKVAAMCMLGGFAETAVAPAHLTFKLSDELDSAQGAGLILNYHTAYFCLVTRGRFQEGETVLVHGAAGGVGTATLQVAKGLGAKTFAVVSSDEKERVAREAGADEVFRSDAAWKDQVKEAGGADIVIDPVGGDRFTDSLRSLAPLGRLLVIGFTAGEIPTVRVNRLLLNNIDVRGVGWGAYAMPREGYTRAEWDKLIPYLESGVVDPPVAGTYPLEKAGEAVALLGERGVLGKAVVEP